MAIETELKLRLAPEQLARLRRHALFRRHQIAAPVTRRLHNIYFDTPTLDLHGNQMALRLRRVGGRWIQTLKGGGQVRAGLHQRNEWEVAITSAKLDFSGLDPAVWDEHLPPALRDSLQAVFVTDFYRTTRLIQWQGAQIEVCMDHGEVRTAQCSSPICEVELELKDGQPQQLFELALVLLEIVPFELELVSKAELGFRLMAKYVAHPAKATVPTVAADAGLSDALQAMIWSGLQHLQRNLHAAMGDGTDAEYLHQLRVALRRLRVVLRMAEKCCADETLAQLRQELAEFGVALGRVRDWDVFAAALRNGPYAGEAALLSACERHRNLSKAALLALLPMQKIQKMLLRFSLWMNSAYWQQALSCSPATRDFACRRLQQLAKRYHRAALNLAELDATQLHELRKLAKKLRYSTEYFAGLYNPYETKCFLAVLAEVQELLGEYNDVTVAHSLLDILAADVDRVLIDTLRTSENDKLSKNINKLSAVVDCSIQLPVFWQS